MSRPGLTRLIVFALMLAAGAGCTVEPTVPTVPETTSTVTQASATASPEAAAQRGPETTVVRRGTVAEAIPLPGRVAMLDEVPVMPSMASRVTRVLVSPRDTVTQGQALFEADTSGL